MKWAKSWQTPVAFSSSSATRVVTVVEPDLYVKSAWIRCISSVAASPIGRPAGRTAPRTPAIAGGMSTRAEGR